ncbi:hypothetical protein Q8A73_006179 [Channa argus]|nr:hypothetical protein Q8A73_006179 [Channa argus]
MLVFKEPDRKSTDGHKIPQKRAPSLRACAWLAFQTNTEEEKKRGRRRGKDNKRLRLLLHSPGSTHGLHGAILRGPFGVRSERQLLFRRHFSHKMADTPLPQHGAFCTTFLLHTSHSAALRAENPVILMRETFRRMSAGS